MIPIKSKASLADLFISLVVLPAMLEAQRVKAAPAPKSTGTPAVESDEEISAIEQSLASARPRLFGVAVPAAEQAAEAAQKERATLKFGDRVKITRAALGDEKNIGAGWTNEMNKAVGKTGIVVCNGQGQMGIQVAVPGLTRFYFYPGFVLKKQADGAAIDGPTPSFEFIRNGDVFKKDDGEAYIMGNVDEGKYALISLRNGNRWANPTATPEAAFSGERHRFTKQVGPVIFA